MILYDIKESIVILCHPEGAEAILLHLSKHNETPELVNFPGR